MVASVLSTAVLRSAGSNSSTNSFKLSLSSKEISLFFSIKSSAEDLLLYFNLSSLIAVLTEMISEFVISANVFLDNGLPFKYKTASIRVTKEKLVELLFSKLG